MGFCQEPPRLQQGQQPQQAIKSTWANSWEEAVKLSKQSGKPIMLQFAGSDWCVWCQRLEQDVLSQPEFVKWSDRVIKLRVDFPANFQLPKREQKQNEVLKEWYGDFVKSYPTCLFIQPDGHVIGTLGYVDGGVKQWINRAEGVLLNMGDLHASATHGWLSPLAAVIEG